MKKSLKIILIIIAVAILFGIVFFSKNKKTFVANNPIAPITVEKNSAITNTSEKDSDNDGLYDWEEELWHTDPNKADTDGDGTSDSAEVKAGRNPLIAGPNDALKSEDSKNGGQASTSQAELTATEKLGREMFSKYLSMKQAGVIFDSSTTETFVNNLIQENINNFSYKIYTLNDLNISKDESVISLKAYGNALSDIVSKNSSHTENELMIFSRFSDSGNKEELKNLKPIMNSYKSILQKELALQVPDGAKNTHLAFINALSFVLSSLQSMTEAENDPFIILISIQRHAQGAQELKDSITGLQNYFKENSIDFAQEDAGYGMFGGI